MKVKFSIFLLAITAFVLEAHAESKCSFDLGGFTFKMSPKGNVQLFGAHPNRNFVVHVKSSNQIIVLSKDTSKSDCEEIILEVDPTLLCRTNDVVEPWTYWVDASEGESKYSIISKRTDTTGIAAGSVIRDSKLCGYTKISGKVEIKSTELTSEGTVEEPSIIKGLTKFVRLDSAKIKGKIRIENTSSTDEVRILNSEVKKGGTFKTSGKLLSIFEGDIQGTPDIDGGFVMNKGVIKNAPIFRGNIFSEMNTISGGTFISNLPTKKSANDPNISIKNTFMGGNPTINSSGDFGIVIERMYIPDSPTIRDELYIHDASMIGNGTYKGASQTDSEQTYIPVIAQHVEGTNNFQGIYFLNGQYISNTSINGTVSRDENGMLKGFLTVFPRTEQGIENSSLNGIVHMYDGYIHHNGYVNGYAMGPAYAGVIVENGHIFNGSRVSGGVLLDSTAYIDNSILNGNTLKEGQYIQHISGGVTTESTISNAPRIVNSTLYRSSVSGTAYVVSAYLYSSSAYCNAYVAGGTHSNESMGCNYPNNFAKEKFDQSYIFANNLFKMHMTKYGTFIKERDLYLNSLKN